ncbi:hypothetical protein E2320_011619, partial [Naja naja]
AKNCDQEPEVLGRELWEGSPRLALALSGAWFFGSDCLRPALRKRERRRGIAIERPPRKAFARFGDSLELGDTTLPRPRRCVCLVRCGLALRRRTGKREFLEREPVL